MTATASTLLLECCFEPCNLFLELSKQRVLGILVDLRLVLYVLGTVSVPVIRTCVSSGPVCQSTLLMTLGSIPVVIRDRVERFFLVCWFWSDVLLSACVFVRFMALWSFGFFTVTMLTEDVRLHYVTSVTEACTFWSVLCFFKYTNKSHYQTQNAYEMLHMHQWHKMLTMPVAVMCQHKTDNNTRMAL